MQNCQITYCQQAKGKSQKRRNQDALFNGKEVLQCYRKITTTFIPDYSHFILGVADGVYSSGNSSKASQFWCEQLAECQQNKGSLTYQWLCETQEVFNTKLAKHYFGATTTLAAVEIDLKVQQVKLLNVGDSRIYLINSQGEWRQLSYDHTLLSELTNDPTANKNDYASIYSGLASYLVADFQPFQTAYFCDRITVQKGETLLLCTDGLTDTLSVKKCSEIWQKYATNQQRLNVFHKILLNQKYYDDFSIICCEFL
ncbi:protein phosphatase 2C domain-containing protein [Pasteurella skyensis]|uniref:Protein phosphatase 2C domain-containing protein n=1 Tax=Phocoenobacter skyensis TaxID=97481 RepID=A0AAJ6NAU3_9PAST|nr:protein phosphatase 2C domain-containing protein [Pasteurella skyensis]MDP8161588.1 protein phosphatase 2C domain-containing protein [Pasteurella skyensis]MDP8173422.1 protein phosphatase 2C domain-containing protein [Pasteurella skyensis]MDP8175982.1 protein phosphatase 2C domain-containing protein [Pasteurella skyensis]MDP8177950.1 protein phosphatase 2C domain-containing protein [Pasteurella skyensis]MDP8182391.1 protein phosphatase 2C domain-containing protein [Pasteurella skyensis]